MNGLSHLASNAELFLHLDDQSTVLGSGRDEQLMWCPRRDVNEISRRDRLGSSIANPRTS
jgi:hypothetical protein